MKILLTGFDPFGELKTNPSQTVIQAIKERWKPRLGVDLATEVLPTEYAAAESRIRKLVREQRPDVILSVGVSQNLSSISLERIAVNLDDECAPDNAGEVRRGRRIVFDGAPAYWSTLPLERIRNLLRGRGVPVSFSNHAGTYVCNHVFYATLDEIRLRDFEARCGLIHVPLVAKQSKRSNKVGIGLPLDIMIIAIEGCIEAILKPEKP